MESVLTGWRYCRTARSIRLLARGSNNRDEPYFIEGMGMKWLYNLIEALMKERFWGEVIIKFRDGKPVIVDKNQQIKVPDID